VPAEVEEAVANADAVDAKQFFPHRREHSLDVIARLDEIAVEVRAFELRAPLGLACCLHVRGIGRAHV